MNKTDAVWVLACVFVGISSPLLKLCCCACVLQVLAFYSSFEQCELAVDGSENWLKVQAPPASEPEPLKVQLDRCRVSEIECF